MTASLNELPPELQSAIIKWILRPRHLASVCRVSKRLHAITMPILYRVMKINVNKWNLDHLERFLTYGHPGLQYVRALDIDYSGEFSETIALKAAKDALQVLPRNCLMLFRCPLESGMDNDLMILLAATQRNLQIIAIGCLGNNAMNIPTCLQPWPPAIDTIVIPFRLNGWQETKFYQQMIERSGKALKALTVRAERLGPIFEEMVLDEKDTTEVLARCLFTHGLPNKTRVELKDLNFQCQDFSLAASTWVQVVDFSKLRSIRIWNCNEVDNLFQALLDSSTHEPLHLEGLILSLDRTSQFPTLAQEFVSSISGLQYLQLCYAPVIIKDTGFDLRCLEKHKSTLKDLYLGIGANDIDLPPLHRFSHEELKWICSNCVGLRQLAIALPVLRLDDACAGRWGKFGDALELLATLPRLKVLRILTWPHICDYEFSVSPAPSYRLEQKRHYLSRLQIVATAIASLFSRLRGDQHDRLSVIAFGSAEKQDWISRVDGSQTPCCDGPYTYRVTREYGEFGFRLKVNRIEPEDMEYVEPIAFVKDEDTDQGLCLEQYPWGGQP